MVRAFRLRIIGALVLLVLLVLPRGRVAPAIPAVHAQGESSQAATTLAMRTYPLPPMTAPAAALFDAQTGQWLYLKNPDRRLPMASTTKIMTALVAIERGRQDAVYRVSRAAATVIGTRMGLRRGERVSLRDLLYGLLLPSGNDAAITIAEGIAGSQAAFVRLMNAKARALGLRNTHYVTPHGLDHADHYSSARDLVLVARAAMQLPLFRRIVSTPRLLLPPTATHHRYALENSNAFLAWYPGADGVKPGWTPRAGTCLVESVSRFGRHLIGVVLGSPLPVTDIRDLFNYGVGDFQWIPSSPHPDTPDRVLSTESPAAPGLYFPVSGHAVTRAFLAYFQTHGGLAVVGYPLTEAFRENGQLVQYFSRARLVADPRTQTSEPTPLGALSVPTPQLLRAIAPVANTAWRTYYPQTGHTVTWAFRRFYLAYAGVATFGYPLTEKVTIDGRLVQFFRNAEFVWQPTSGTHGVVVVAPLGARLLAHLTAPQGGTPTGPGQSPRRGPSL